MTKDHWLRSRQKFLMGRLLSEPESVEFSSMRVGFHTAKAIEGERRPPRELSNNVVMEDWDFLFNAVVGRLRSTLEDMESGIASRRSLTSSQARDSILECAQALDQLHLTATQEFSRYRQTDDV